MPFFCRNYYSFHQPNPLSRLLCCPISPFSFQLYFNTYTLAYQTRLFYSVRNVLLGNTVGCIPAGNTFTTSSGSSHQKHLGLALNDPFFLPSDANLNSHYNFVETLISPTVQNFISQNFNNKFRSFSRNAIDINLQSQASDCSSTNLVPSFTSQNSKAFNNSNSFQNLHTPFCSNISPKFISFNLNNNLANSESTTSAIQKRYTHSLVNKTNFLYNSIASKSFDSVSTSISSSLDIKPFSSSSSFSVQDLKTEFPYPQPSNSSIFEVKNSVSKHSSGEISSFATSSLGDSLTSTKRKSISEPSVNFDSCFSSSSDLASRKTHQLGSFSGISDNKNSFTKSEANKDRISIDNILAKDTIEKRNLTSISSIDIKNYKNGISLNSTSDSISIDISAKNQHLTPIFKENRSIVDIVNNEKQGSESLNNYYSFYSEQNCNCENNCKNNSKEKLEVDVEKVADSNTFFTQLNIAGISAAQNIFTNQGNNNNNSNNKETFEKENIFSECSFSVLSSKPQLSALNRSTSSNIISSSSVSSSQSTSHIFSSPVSSNSYISSSSFFDSHNISLSHSISTTSLKTPSVFSASSSPQSNLTLNNNLKYPTSQNNLSLTKISPQNTFFNNFFKTLLFQQKSTSLLNSQSRHTFVTDSKHSQLYNNEFKYNNNEFKHRNSELQPKSNEFQYSQSQDINIEFKPPRRQELLCKQKGGEFDFIRERNDDSKSNNESREFKEPRNRQYKSSRGMSSRNSPEITTYTSSASPSTHIISYNSDVSTPSTSSFSTSSFSTSSFSTSSSSSTTTSSSSNNNNYTCTDSNISCSTSTCSSYNNDYPCTDFNIGSSTSTSSLCNREGLSSFDSSTVVSVFKSFASTASTSSSSSSFEVSPASSVVASVFGSTSTATSSSSASPCIVSNGQEGLERETEAFRRRHFSRGIDFPEPIEQVGSSKAGGGGVFRRRVESTGEEAVVSFSGSASANAEVFFSAAASKTGGHVFIRNSKEKLEQLLAASEGEDNDSTRRGKEGHSKENKHDHQQFFAVPERENHNSTREKHDSTREKNDSTREKHDSAREKYNSRKEKHDATREDTKQRKQLFYSPSEQSRYSSQLKKENRIEERGNQRTTTSNEESSSSLNNNTVFFHNHTETKETYNCSLSTQENTPKKPHFAEQITTNTSNQLSTLKTTNQWPSYTILTNSYSPTSTFQNTKKKCNFPEQPNSTHSSFSQQHHIEKTKPNIRDKTFATQIEHPQTFDNTFTKKHKFRNRHNKYPKTVKFDGNNKFIKKIEFDGNNKFIKKIEFDGNNKFIKTVEFDGNNKYPKTVEFDGNNKYPKTVEFDGNKKYPKAVEFDESSIKNRYKNNNIFSSFIPSLQTTREDIDVFSRSNVTSEKGEKDIEMDVFRNLLFGVCSSNNESNLLLDNVKAVLKLDIENGLIDANSLNNSISKQLVSNNNLDSFYYDAYKNDDDKKALSTTNYIYNNKLLADNDNNNDSCGSSFNNNKLSSNDDGYKRNLTKAVTSLYKGLPSLNHHELTWFESTNTSPHCAMNEFPTSSNRNVQFCSKNQQNDENYSKRHTSTISPPIQNNLKHTSSSPLLINLKNHSSSKLDISPLSLSSLDNRSPSRISTTADYTSSSSYDNISFSDDNQFTSSENISSSPDCSFSSPDCMSPSLNTMSSSSNDISSPLHNMSSHLNSMSSPSDSMSSRLDRMSCDLAEHMERKGQFKSNYGIFRPFEGLLSLSVHTLKIGQEYTQKRHLHLSQKFHISDPYKTLNINKSATNDEIKKKFRELAKKYHPDINKTEEAKSKMSEITSAYEILSDPQKRRFYDQTGMSMDEAGGSSSQSGFSAADPSFMFSDFADMFSRMASGNMGASFFTGGSTSSSRGEDIQTEISIDLMEAIKGIDKSIRISSKVTCNECKGSGCKPGTSVNTCKTCGGTGVQRVERGPIIIGIPCNRCNGSGQVIAHPCGHCNGNGVKTKPKTINVEIPAGVKQGMQMRVPNQGHMGIRGGKPGHLFVSININPHPTFKWIEDDIHMDIPLTLKQCFLGGTLQIETLNGSMNYSIPPNTSPSSVKMLYGKGPPKIEGKGGHGHLVLHFSLKMPINLSKKQVEAIEEFDRLEDEKNKNSIKPINDDDNNNKNGKNNSNSSSEKTSKIDQNSTNLKKNVDSNNEQQNPSKKQKIDLKTYT